MGHSSVLTGHSTLLLQTLTQSTSKVDRMQTASDTEPRDKNGSQARGFSTDPPGLRLLPPRPPLQHQTPTPSGPPLFQSPAAALESLKLHRSVIQATGLVGSSEPLALLTQPGREASPKARAPPSTPSPPTLSPSSVKSGSRSLCDEPLSQIHDFTVKAVSGLCTFCVSWQHGVFFPLPFPLYML